MPAALAITAALTPAVTLSVVAAFEGFVEEFLAAVLLTQGHGFAQVARKVALNNPTPRLFASKMSAEVPAVKAQLGDGFTLQVWNIPQVNGHPATETIDWSLALERADGRMEVRHCLTHGLASGWRSEVWPAPLKGAGATTSSSVLRAKPGGKHSIGLTGALSCARLHVYTARHIATLLAGELGEQIDWHAAPEYPLKKIVS
ncbi:hypothetical protein [Amycolatopsis sp. H20-H5]|uniref:hypothetical protein n=1 Tax=Amycolatopsis sp. H20-H5 TaxID=3046309 RepID=UPI002DB7EA9D|nr:hypothetical protein [Amycolatopsis sp. H20-H5]MEC3978163.1 hypothetical protein [Amycolatopsis sp. H20-H5]